MPDPPFRDPEGGEPLTSAGGQNDSPADVTAGAGGVGSPPAGARRRRHGAIPGKPAASSYPSHPAWLVTLVRAVLLLMMRGAARAYFRRVTVHHRGRCPRHGALLVVANHPATWTDVLLLHVALRRRLHFMAQAALYRPWIRRWFLRLYETLPVYHPADATDPATLNAETLRAAHRMLDRGEAVVAFPEGVSLTDWRIQPFRAGAARLALGYEALPGRERHLAVIPVGLHYEDRTRLRGGVEITIGRPVDLTAFRRRAKHDPPAAVRALSERLFEGMADLVVHFPDADREALGRELAPIVLPSWRAVRPRGDALPLMRELAAAIERLGAEDNSRVEELWRLTKRYRRMRGALGTTDRALRETAPGERTWPVALGLIVVGMGGAVPALVGVALNLVPHALTAMIVRRFAPESSRIAFARITAGVVLFPATYVLWGWGIHHATGLSHPLVAGLLALGLLLGLVAVGWWRWLEADLVRLRLIRLERRAPRQVARVRAARARLLDLVTWGRRS